MIPSLTAKVPWAGYSQLSATGLSLTSLSTSTLKLMKKGTSVFVNLALLLRCLRYEVNPQWNLLVGFPGEKDDVYEKYVADLDRLASASIPVDIVFEQGMDILGL